MRIIPTALCVWMFGPELVELVDHLGRIRKCGLVGAGVTLRLRFEVSKVHTKPSVSPFPSWSPSNLTSYLRSGCKLLAIATTTCLPVAMLPTMVVMESPSGTISKPPIKHFLNCFAHGSSHRIKQWVRHMEKKQLLNSDRQNTKQNKNLKPSVLTKATPVLALCVAIILQH